MVLVVILQVAGAVVALGALALLSLQTGFVPIRAGEFEETALTVTDCSDTAKGTLSVRTADSLSQQVIGLSRTDSLEQGDGIVFPHDSEGAKRVEMRNMNFGLDVLFVDADGEITEITTLDAPDSTLEYYLTYDSAFGQGQYVIETNAGWSEAHGVEPGDCVTGLSETA
jgi:uncharacterized membrane protein (UPF0127 family)